MKRHVTVSHVVASVLACGMTSAAVDAAPANLDRTVTLDIEAQPLETALVAFSQQTDIQVVLNASRADSAATSSVKGRVSARAGLSELLKGTGFRYSPIGDRTVSVMQEGADPRATLMRIAALSGADAEAAQSSSSAGGDDTSAKGSLEEVVVTAQKREERLKDVPISISVLGGQALDKSTVQGVTEALGRVPGVAALISGQGGGTQVVMRGVGASGATLNGSSPIGYYLDGVPFGLVKSAIQPDSSAYDLERVEVLRGPQGTLYGASAAGGLVRVLTRDANVDEFEFKARTSLSSTDGGSESYSGDAAINIPIVEGKLAARAVVGYQNLSGWVDSPIKDDTNDADLRAYRLKVNAQPTDQLSIGLSAWVSRSDFGAPSRSLDDGTVTTTRSQPISTDYETYGFKVGYDFPGFSVLSTTGYLDYRNASDIDVNPTLGLLFTGFYSKIVTEEILVNSNQQGPWRWTLGGFYRKGKDRLLQVLTPIFTEAAPAKTADVSESYAAFGEVSRRFLDDRFEWTLGLRYFHDDVFNTGSGGLPVIDQSETFNSTTPRAVLTWYPNPEVTAYVSYSEGFRSGFPQNSNITSIVPDFPSVEPDKLHNYEIGAKAELFDRRLAFDAAVYYIDWEDVQQTTTMDFQGIPITAPINGESAGGMGVDLSVTLRPAEGLQLGINASWNDLQIDADVLAGAGNSLVFFREGDRLASSPEYTFGASAEYSFPLGGSGYMAAFSTSANYLSKLESHQPGATDPVIFYSDNILIARAELAIESGDQWSVALFADNINNEDGAVQQQQTNANQTARTRPRTIGLQFEYRY